jgi:hypothetical protein
LGGTFNPGGTPYPNHEALAFAVREAAGQMMMLIIPASLLAFAGLYLATAPSLGRLLSFQFLALAGSGLILSALIGWTLLAGAAYAPRLIRVRQDGIVAEFRSGSLGPSSVTELLVPFDSMISFAKEGWEARSAGKAAWYEFNPPQVRFLSDKILPKWLRSDRSERQYGVLYLTDDNLVRVQTACGAWREQKTADAPSTFRTENEMDEETARSLGEV